MSSLSPAIYLIQSVSSSLAVSVSDPVAEVVEAVGDDGTRVGLVGGFRRPVKRSDS